MSTRTFALIFGIAFLLIGLSGFIPGMHQPGTPHADLTMTDGYSHALGLFPVNILHNIVHIVFGLWGLAAWRGMAGGPRTYARGVAIIYALLMVMGLVDGLNTTFGFIPLYGNDVWLHAVLAIVAAYFGWMNRDTAGDRG